MGRKKSANWLVVGLVFTVAYFSLVIWLLGWRAVVKFVSSNPESLNAVGDFTAGMFAPIAVIWLVAAVLTQRQELEEAREQSRLAQRQFEDNQTVIDDQLQLIKSQNALLQLQHEQSVSNAAKAYRLSLYDKRLKIYEKFVAIGNTYNSDTWAEDDAYWELINLSHEAAFVFDKTIEDWISDIAEQAHEYQQYRESNRIKMYVDQHGNQLEEESERNEEIRKECNRYVWSIKESFLPEERLARFWAFMQISSI